MADLGILTERLRSLDTRRPTPERRAEVVAVLSSKYEGVQSVAAQVLAAWGGRESVDVLRGWLAETLRRKQGWAITGVAVGALRGLVESDDVSWVLDLYFGATGWKAKDQLTPLVFALPPKDARGRLVEALSDPLAENRRAAVEAIGNMAYADHERLLMPLYQDRDKHVRDSARFFSQQRLA